MTTAAKQVFALLCSTSAIILLGQGCSNMPKVRERTSSLQTAGARSPASAPDSTFELEYQEIKVCGRIYSFPLVKSPDPELHLIFEEQPLPGSSLRISLPGKLANYRSHHQTFTRTGVQTAPAHDLLLLLPVTSDDLLIQKHYCENLSAVRKYFTNPANRGQHSSFKTKLGELNISARAKGQRIRNQLTFDLTNQFDVPARPDFSNVPNESEPSASFFNRLFPIHPPTSARLDHVVIATKDYLLEAQALSQGRIQAGLGSRAISLEQIPGIQPGDAVPAQCQGAYFDECYLTAAKPANGVSFYASTGLTGMRSWNDMDSPAYRKIADAAGMVRAYLRTLKLEHPELKYIVLMGDLFQLPPRFTTRNSYYSGPAPVENFLSTDYYYADLFSVWMYSNRISFSSINPTGWPCGDECAQPNTNWDTTAFRWPISYPFARTLVDPINHFDFPVQNALGIANMVSVGRIVAKPPVGQSKDPAVMKYVEKLARWELNPGERSQIKVISGDGVYFRKHLQDFENQLGPFQYFGEGFGASYVTAANRPSDYSTVDCIHQPSANDWHSYPLTANYGFDRLYDYQSEPLHCKPLDPQANWMRLPDPAEVTREVSRTGFTFMFHSAHAGYAGIGYQSGGNGYSDDRSFRNFGVRYNEGGKYSQPNRPRYEDFANFLEVNGHANGFVISSGCSPSSYFNGLPAVPLYPNHGRSAAEDLTMLENAGGVGTYMNTDVGYFYSDPLFEMDLIRSMKSVGNALTVPRFGDVTIDLFKTVVPVQNDTYQILNRVFLGDPSAKLFHKINIQLDPIPVSDKETP